ncbi:glycosyltransferase family 2 protein [Hyphomonas polymorpha]|nr:glycosyltransferase family 2 protein [Hyphomonas polymorpha]
MNDIHAIILTLNEEMHIERCIRSLSDQCASVTVVDSGSSDRTCEIARNLGARVIVNPFINHAQQMNFAIDQVSGSGGWLFRIDADEVLSQDSRESLRDAVLRAAPDVQAFVVMRRIHFLGRRIRHGAVEPSWQLRLWRADAGRCEQRWMDEHILVRGRVDRSGIVIADINLNSLGWWTTKHNGYASREAIEQLNEVHGFLPVSTLQGAGASAQARRKRFLKHHLYRRIPPSLRAAIYFVWRYVFRFGFLDGRPGWYFHLLQGFWYRTLVDAKVMEIQRYADEHRISITAAIETLTGIAPLPPTNTKAEPKANA